MFSKNRVFFTYSNYYNLVSYLNTSENVIVILLLLYCLKTAILKKYNVGKITTPLLLLLLCTLYTQYTVFNCVILYKQKGNGNLLNGLMLIHPPILYLSYVCVCVSLLMGVFIITQNYTQTKHFVKNVRRLYLVQNLLIIFSVLLGCW